MTNCTLPPLLIRLRATCGGFVWMSTLIKVIFFPLMLAVKQPFFNKIIKEIIAYLVLSTSLWSFVQRSTVSNVNNKACPGGAVDIFQTIKL